MSENAQGNANNRLPENAYTELKPNEVYQPLVTPFEKPPELTARSIGWGVFYVCIILSSSIWGILSGEWRGGQGRPMRTMVSGLAILLAAVIILGYANALGVE